MDRIDIYIDNREKRTFKNILRDTVIQFALDMDDKYKKIYKRVSVLDATLDVSDILITDGNNIILIERKTYSDLSSSIKDKRSHKQAARIREYEEKCRNNNIYIESYYLMESSNLRKEDLPEDTIIQAMINKQFRDKFRIIHTSDMKDSALYIKGIIQCILRYGFKDNEKCNEKEKLTLTTKKRVHKEKDQYKESFILMLTCIPRVSYDIAKSIINIYPRPVYLIYDLVDKGEYALVGININDTRKIGKTMSKKIYNHFIGEILQ
jgi:ERCC4-type nuclease